MIRIRLSRKGKKNQPFYRIVAVEQKSKRDGKALEIIGYFNPAKEKLEINKEKLDKFVKNGAQVSKAVLKLLKQ